MCDLQQTIMPCNWQNYVNLKRKWFRGSVFNLTLNLTPIQLGKDNIGQTEYLVRLKLISVQWWSIIESFDIDQIIKLIFKIKPMKFYDLRNIFQIPHYSFYRIVIKSLDLGVHANYYFWYNKLIWTIKNLEIWVWGVSIYLKFPRTNSGQRKLT